jgi:hypothetical protein
VTGKPTTRARADATAKYPDTALFESSRDSSNDQEEDSNPFVSAVLSTFFQNSSVSSNAHMKEYTVSLTPTACVLKTYYSTSTTMSGYPEQMMTFLKASKFAVVGASTDRSKWGNKVLRWYVVVAKKTNSIILLSIFYSPATGIKTVRCRWFLSILRQKRWKG